MIHNNNSLTRLYLISSIFPIFLFIVTGLTVFSSLQTTISEREEIRAPRFILPTLESILIEGEKEENIHKGMLFVGTMDGTIYFNRLGFDSENLSENLIEYGNDFFDTYPSSSILITRFKYRDKRGFCFFDISFLPAYLKSGVREVLVSLIFLIMGGIFILGLRVLRTLKKTTQSLVKASDMIAGGDFSIPEIPLPNNEMDPIVRSIQHMAKELNAKEDMEKRFMMSVTHDLKTPLTSIRGYLEAFRDGMITDPEQIQQTASMMLEKTAILEERIKETIEFSREGYISQFSSSFSLKPFLERILPLLKEDSMARDRHFDFSEDIPDDYFISGQENQFERIIENLFDNACRFTKKGDKIRFTAKKESDNVIFLFEDSGIGVKPENREKIFQLFFREEQGRNSRGMGIGLSMVHSVIEALNGSVSYFESNLGGAGFRLSIPESNRN